MRVGLRQAERQQVSWHFLPLEPERWQSTPSLRVSLQTNGKELQKLTISFLHRHFKMAFWTFGLGKSKLVSFGKRSDE
jgi:hypothetical protein